MLNPMRIVQKIIVLSLAIFIFTFFIPTVFNIICNGHLRLDCWISIGIF